MKSPRVDITGQTFNRLTAVEFKGVGKGGAEWIFRCSCGNVVQKIGAYVKNGNTKSCGCQKIESSTRNLTGQKFGRLTAIKDSGAKQTGSARTRVWLCRCDCGNVVNATTNHLTQGSTKSCGCLMVEKRGANFIEINKLRSLGEISNPCRKHGQCGSGAYRSWQSMKDRCFNSNYPKFNDYGGRGITVCQSWASSFDAFYSDMGDRPSDNHSIDRIDVNGNYEPGNCRWATQYEQCQNMRSTRKYLVDGEMLSISEISNRFDIKRAMLVSRLNRGWDVEKAIKTPAIYDRSSSRKSPV